MPLFSSAKPFKGQNYAALKKECVTNDRLFYDMEFPPEDKSLFHTPGKIANVVWKRPKQICPNPKLFVGGASSGDVTQGRLGNCWFVAASSCLAQYKDIWTKVIPNHEDQEWKDDKPDDYRGIFHFHFWRYGEWLDVVIDDQLPTVNDELIFIHSQSKNEFWSALLEKAYAKLFGNYEVLDGGDLAEALEDFTGGVSEPFNLIDLDVANNVEARDSLFKRMHKEMDRKSLMAAAIPPKTKDDMEASTPSGLVMGHAYGVTSVKNVPLEGTGIFGIFNKDKLPMVRLRNPWGQGEWKGAFSDGSPEWNKISEGDRKKIGLTFDEDGEFWMSFDDYCKHFPLTSICRVVNTSVFSVSKTWNEGLSHGKWSKPGRAGGCMNNKDSFMQNPQYTFDVTEPEDECMIQLMQKSTRGVKGSENHTIGFTILRVEENRRYRIKRVPEIVTSSVFKNGRSIFLRHILNRGRYGLVPCTFEPGLESPFLLRVYTDRANSFRELTLDRPSKAWYNCCGSNPTMVTQIKILRAHGLEKFDKVGGADPYFIVSCEGEKITGRVVKDTLSPEWNQSVVFYRKKPVNAPVKVQIWNSNVIRDEQMGKHVFMSTDECQDKKFEVDLFGRKNESDVRRPGKLIVQITNSRDVSSL